MSSRISGPGGALKRLLIALITAGGGLGAWRWLRKGAGVTDPGWLGNVPDSLTPWGDWARDRISQLSDQVR